MATKIYLVRHAKPDLSIHDDFLVHYLVKV